MATETEDDTFNEETETFMSWLRQRSAAAINPKIRIADLRQIGAGRGVGVLFQRPSTTCISSDLVLVAIEDIEDDEALFHISTKDVLSVENSSLNASHPEIFQHLDSWNSLILTMIHEDGQGVESNWWAYLKVLPRRFDTLIYWSSSELAELQGSAVLDKIGKEAAEHSFVKILLPIVQKHCKLFGAHAAAFQGNSASRTLIDLAHRMATLIMAYGFDLEDEPTSEEEDEEGGSSQQAYESNKGMIPLADMFNANGDLNNVR